MQIQQHWLRAKHIQKNFSAHENKIGTKPNSLPTKTRNLVGMEGFSCGTNAKFQAPTKLAHPISDPRIAGENFYRRFRKGVGGRGLATNIAQNTAEIVLQNYVLLLLRGGIGKRVQEKGMNLWHSKDLPVPTPFFSPTPFRNLRFYGHEFFLSDMLQRAMREEE